jgi:multisubunit Na+/H+ antiporter MnhB subunit
MRRFVTWLSGLAVLLLSLPTLASEGPTTALDHRAATAGLSGANLFLANLYNDRRLAFAAFITVAMAVSGIVIAFTVDGLLASLGLKVTKQGHRE